MRVHVNSGKAAYSAYTLLKHRHAETLLEAQEIIVGHSVIWLVQKWEGGLVVANLQVVVLASPWRERITGLDINPSKGGV